jgi:hypothetical protein
MRGGRGGRGGPPIPKQRSNSPVRDKDDTNETTTAKPGKEEVGQASPRKITQGATKGPPTKQTQRQDTLTRPPGVGATADPPVMIRAVRRWPTIGTGEATDDGHIAAVRNTADLNKLFGLWRDLATQEPHRARLIQTVKDQIIRVQLWEMMGENIATRANIHLDDVPAVSTMARDVKTDRVHDRRRTVGTLREREVWNASLTDSEVDTIRDVTAWAKKVDRQTLAATERIVVQVVGTSGPCEACKQRLTNMANDLVNEWSRTTGLRKDQLPEVQIWSYYGNPTKTFERGGFKDVRNGWVGDRTPPELTFKNKGGDDQLVKVHPLVRVNGKPQVVIAPAQPATTPEKPDTSAEETESSTEEPETSTKKPGSSQDLVSTDL